MSSDRNKRGQSLDLEQPAAVEAVWRMAARADVVVERFRPGDEVTVRGGQQFGIRHDGAYTSAVAVETLERRGVVPGDGEVIVTGATGGCSGFAIDRLAGLGHRVVAMTGKASEHDDLKAIGAARVIGREIQQRHVKPLDGQLRSGAIDAVGGARLDFVLHTMRRGGVVTAFGNAAGQTFPSPRRPTRSSCAAPCSPASTPTLRSTVPR